MKKIFLILTSLIIFILPLAVFANGSTGVLPNPMKCDNLLCLFLSVIRLLLGAVGTFALFVFMWGGFLMLTSGGSAEQVKKAKDALLWSSIGVVTILASWAIIQYLMKAVIESTY